MIALFKPGDGIVREGDGPLTVVGDFLSETSDFAVDAERERYILLYNPRGYLK
jgi:hypothetical protein